MFFLPVNELHPRPMEGNAQNTIEVVVSSFELCLYTIFCYCCLELLVKRIESSMLLRHLSFLLICPLRVSLLHTDAPPSSATRLEAGARLIIGIGEGFCPIGIYFGVRKVTQPILPANPHTNKIFTIPRHPTAPASHHLSAPAHSRCRTRSRRTTRTPPACISAPGQIRPSRALRG